MTTDLMLKKFFSFNGLTTVMLKWILCGSEGIYDDIYLFDIINADYFCKIITATAQQC